MIVWCIIVGFVLLTIAVGIYLMSRRRGGIGTMMLPFGALVMAALFLLLIGFTVPKFTNVEEVEEYYED